MKRKWTSNYGPDGQTFTHHYSVYIEDVFTNNQKTNQPRTQTKHSYKLQLLVNESHKFYKTDYYYNTFDINQSKIHVHKSHIHKNIDTQTYTTTEQYFFVNAFI